MKTRRLGAAALAAFLLPAIASAVVLKRVPVVTQVHGATFYRTLVMIANASSSPTAIAQMALTYRSTVDGTLQSRPLTLNSPIGAGQAVTFEDIVQTFKDSGTIRQQDLGADIFGTLLVTASGLAVDSGLLVIARTYSPSSCGGTNGIAYAGRSFAGSQTELVTFIRNGEFGPDGTTRANIGIVNEGSGSTDVQITYREQATNALMKQFRLSDVTHHPLGPGEVVQLNNVFADPLIPGSTKVMRVEIRPVATTRAAVSGYAVQLDGSTNDGSFFLMSELGSSAAATDVAPAEEAAPEEAPD